MAQDAVQFDPIDIQKMQRKFKIIERGFKTSIEKAMLAGVKSVEADAKKNVVRDTSRLARSITSGLSKLFPDVEGVVGANTVYAGVIEFGRRPGRKPPPSDVIANWLKRKGGDPEMAFVVARAIGKKGMRPRPYLIPALQANMGKIERLVADAMRKTINDAKEED